MSPDIHALTGAYAVDALDEEERRFFEAHLADCEACQREVAELQETAARLGAAADEPPPPSLKADVMAEIDRTRQERPVPTTPDDADAAPSGRPWHQRLLVPVAAALAVIVVGLGVVVANLNQRIDQLEAASAPLEQILTAPDVVVLEAEGPGGSLGRVVASPTRGEGVFLVDGMAPAPEQRTYQLWLIGDDGATPAGLFEVGDDGRARHVMSGDMTAVDAIGVTVEPEGGSPQPTTDPVMVVEVPRSA